MAASSKPLEGSFWGKWSRRQRMLPLLSQDLPQVTGKTFWRLERMPQSEAFVELGETTFSSYLLKFCN
jgi:hypothetical protein